MHSDERFPGFPVAALDFYDDLEVDNTRSFWAAHRHRYEAAVRAPMVALVGALTDEFGAAKVFRPYRDVRYAKDKTPYKDHQGAFVAAAPATGWYVEIGAPGVRVGAGLYRAAPARLAAIRAAIGSDRTGSRLEDLLTELEGRGWKREGDRLRTAPRGWLRDHPRIDLLRHRSLYVGRSYSFDEVIHTPALVERVRADWRDARALIDWLEEATDGVATEPDARR